jgi:hypothetical protein
MAKKFQDTNEPPSSVCIPVAIPSLMTTFLTAEKVRMASEHMLAREAAPLCGTKILSPFKNIP